MAVTLSSLRPIVYRGNKEIAAAVGIPFQEIGKHVRENGMPCFKINGTGSWLAHPEDLKVWLIKKRDEQMKGK